MSMKADRYKKIIIFIYLFAFFIKIPFLFFTTIFYDETAYSYTIANIVKNHSWLHLYNSSDLFFFPPLFNYIASIFVIIGMDRLYAVRLVSILLSSGIPPILFLIMKKQYSNKVALITAFLWLFLPYAFLFGILGMVESSMIFFLILSIYFLFTKQENKKHIFLSALFFAASIWIKETPIGLIPLFFIFVFLKKERILSCFFSLFLFLFFL